MSSVDTRIVQMQFDNKQFESGIKTSLDSLNQLDKSIHATESSKGIGGLSAAVETVQSRFSAMEVIAVTALANITNSAVNAGKKLLSSLTIDPIKTGLSEYETQINAVQTILANTESKGTTLDQVNSALDTLNTYADKTIYNFTEMTKNIGTFTAAGVDLDTAVNAIQGIANLAAVSGSTSQQASTAMYQLSQALSSGTVKLMDWNSVTNAGMGGQVFQDALKETARVHGIAIDDMIETEGSFRETLKSGWLTSEILTETLEKFTMTTEGLTEAEIEQNRVMLKNKGYTDEQIEAIFKLGNTATNAATKVKTFTQLLDTTKEAAQSGWTQSWEIIVGDFEEAKELWTNVSNVLGEFIGSSANARNEMLQTWKDLGGRTELINALKAAFQGVVNVITPIKEAFREIFPRTTGKQLFDITNGFKGLMESFKAWTENAENIDNIKRTFKGLFAILNIGKKILGAVFKVFKTLLGITGEAAGGFLHVTAAIGDFFVALDNAIEKGNIFGFVADKLSSGLSFIFEGIKTIVKGVGGAFGLFKNVDTSGFDEFITKLKTKFEPIIKIGKFIWTALSTVWSVIKKVASLIGKVLKDLGTTVSNAIEGGDYDTLLDIVDTVMVGGLAGGLTTFFVRLSRAFKKGGGVLDSITDVIDGVRDVFKAFQNDLNAKALLKIAGAIAILTISLIALSFMDLDDLSGALGVMIVLIGALFAGLALVAKATNGGGKGGINITQVNKVGSALAGLGIAVLALAAACRMLTGFSWDELWPAAAVIGSLTVIMGTFMLVMAKVGKTTTTLNKSGLSMEKSGLARGALTIIAFAGAIYILASAIMKLQNVSWDSIAVGTGVIVGLIGALGTVAIVMSKTGKSAKGALTILALAAAMHILIPAIKKLGEMDYATLGDGLTALCVALLAISTAMRIAGNTGVGFLLVAAALHILIPAIRKLGEMNTEILAKGVIALSIAMLALAGAMRLMPAKDITKKTIGFLAITVAILALSHALKTVATLDMTSMTHAGIILAGLLVVMGLVALMAKKAVAGAAGIAIMSASLALVAGSLALLATQNMAKVTQAGVVLAGLVVVMGIIAVVAKKAIVGAAAIAILSTSLLMVAGALAIVAMLPLESIAVGVVAMVAALGVLAMIAAALSTLGPIILVGAGALALIGAAMLITATSTVVFAAGIAALASSFKAFAQLSWGEIGKSIGMLTVILIAFAAAAALMTVASPCLLIGGAALVVFGTGLSVVGAGLTVVSNGLRILASTLAMFLSAITNFIDNMMDMFERFTNGIPDSFKECGINIVLGLVNGIKSALGGLWELITSVGQLILNKIKEKLGIHSPSTEFADIGKNTILGFINGFKSLLPNVWDTVTNFVSNIVNKVKNGLANFGDTAKEAVSNFVSGLSSKVSGAVETVRNFASNCVDGLKDKVSGFASAGKDVIGGFVSGIKSKLSDAKDAASDVGRSALNSIKNFLGIHSPSKEFAEIGKYSDEGFAGGLKKFSGVVSKSATGVGKTAIDSLNKSVKGIVDVVGDNLDTSPTIRPVIDLSDVEAGSKELDGMFDASGVITVDSAVSRASAINNGMNSSAVDEQHGQNGTSINFTQNNYSPKALSKTDIYRQTKNQFSIMKGALNKS